MIAILLEEGDFHELRPVHLECDFLLLAFAHRDLALVPSYILLCFRISLLAPGVVFNSSYQIDVFCVAVVTANTALYINCAGEEL